MVVVLGGCEDNGRAYGAVALLDQGDNAAVGPEGADDTRGQADRRQPLAQPDPPRVLRADVPPRERCGYGLRERDDGERRLHLVQRSRLVESQVAHPRPTQRGQMRPDTERAAEVASK